VVPRDAHSLAARSGRLNRLPNAAHCPAHPWSIPPAHSSDPFSGLSLALRRRESPPSIGSTSPPLNPGTFIGTADRDETVVFPSSQDTWSIDYYPYWRHAGDTVYGTHTISMGTVNHADIALHLSTNVLTPGWGFVNLDFRLNGTTVGSSTVREALLRDQRGRCGPAIRHAQ
jgi:hypothetical protein